MQANLAQSIYINSRSLSQTKHLFGMIYVNDITYRDVNHGCGRKIPGKQVANNDFSRGKKGCLANLHSSRTCRMKMQFLIRWPNYLFEARRGSSSCVFGARLV